MPAKSKHFGFVESTANSAMATAESTYSSAKGKTVSATNSFVVGAFSQLEKLGSPLLAFTRSHGISLLLMADSTVDTSASAVRSTAKMSRTSATKLVGEARVSKAESVAAGAVSAVTTQVNTIVNERIPAGASAVKTTSQRLFADLSGTVSSVLQRLVDGAHAADRAAAAAVSGLQSRAAAARDGMFSRAAAARDAVFDIRAHVVAAYKDAYGRVVPLVKDYAASSYTSARDSITAQPLYAQAYHAASTALTYGADTNAARTAKSVYAQRVYPRVAPLVDKATPYVLAMLREARPAAAAETTARADDASVGLPSSDILLQSVDEGPRRVGKPVRRKAPHGSSEPGPVEAALRAEAE